MVVNRKPGLESEIRRPAEEKVKTKQRFLAQGAEQWRVSQFKTMKSNAVCLFFYEG